MKINTETNDKMIDKMIQTLQDNEVEQYILLTAQSTEATDKEENFQWVGQVNMDIPLVVEFIKKVFSENKTIKEEVLKAMSHNECMCRCNKTYTGGGDLHELIKSVEW